MANKTLGKAKSAKNDEFYTQYADIQKEVNAYLEYDENAFRDKTVLLPCDDPEWSNFTKFFAQNFESLGLKKLISTSYAIESKNYKLQWQPTLFEQENPNYDISKSKTNGKIFTLERDTNGNGVIDIDDLEWDYLEGDGDFRSDEVRRLRDEADIIVTNPPFLPWIMEAGKKFLIIGNINAITYSCTFPLIKDNKVWIGATNFNVGMFFRVPDNFAYAATYKSAREIDGEKVNRVPSCCWYTNMEHGRRHQPLRLMTMEDNRKFSKHEEVKGIGYFKYENYDALEVPYFDAIPSDYDEVIGVPITFLDKYCPEQFEIVGASESEGVGFSNGLWKENSTVAQPLLNGVRKYKRLFIRKKR